MRGRDDTALARNGKSLVLAHGLEHGPKQFAGVEGRLDPNTVFEMVTHDAVTALAVGKVWPRVTIRRTRAGRTRASRRASGLAVYRDVWQRSVPVDVRDKLQAVVFEGASASEVLD